MANDVQVEADWTVAPATITNQLTTMHATTPITQIITGNAGIPAQGAALLWAQQHGIPWLCMGAYLDGAGYDQYQRGVFVLTSQNPDQVVTSGPTPKPVTTAAAATSKGKPVTKV